MARVKLPQDPGLDLARLHAFLHARMGDRYLVEPFGSGKRALTVRASDWYGCIAGVKQKPKKNETVVWFNRGIPTNKRFWLIPTILITIWPYLIIFAILASKAKPVEDEIRYHLENTPKPISSLAVGPPPQIPAPPATAPPPPPPPPVSG